MNRWFVYLALVAALSLGVVFSAASASRSEANKRDAARMESLEAQVRTLSEAVAKERARVQELSARLERAEMLSFSNPVLYVSGIVAVLALVWLIFGPLRNGSQESRVHPWWRSKRGSRRAGSPAIDDDPIQTDPRAFGLPSSPPAYDPPAPSAKRRAQVAIAPSSPPIATQQAPMTPRPSPLNSRQLLDSTPTKPRVLQSVDSPQTTESRQQAEFFIALGRHDDAIASLKRCLLADMGPNPWIYLDLLAVYHNLGRKPEYEQCRDTFHQLFTGSIPAYADYGQPGKSLEDYPDLCQIIASLWSSKGVVDFLERRLVRSSVPPPAPEIDLEAYRDMLMLYSIAVRNASLGWGSAGFVSFKPSVRESKHAGAEVDFELDSVSPAAQPVDFDLNDLTEDATNSRKDQGKP